MRSDAFDPEILEAFLQEARALLEGLDEAARDLSEGGGDLDRLAYAMQTIGGNGRMLGLSAIESLARSAEEVLGLVKKRKLDATPRLEEVLASTLGTLRGLVGRLEAKEELPGEPPEILTELRSFLAVTEGGARKLPRPRTKTGAKPPTPNADRPTTTTTIDYLSLDQAIFQAFLQEAAEHLDGIEEAVVSLQEDPASVDRLFRAMHTLKGSSNMLGFVQIGALSHTAEEILDRIRSGSLAPSQRIEEVLLACVDHLGGMLAALAERNAEIPENPELLAGLRSLLEGGTAAPPEPAARPAPAPPPPSPEVPATVREEILDEEKRAPWQSGRYTRSYVRPGVDSVRMDVPKLDDIFNRMGEMVIGRIRLESSLESLSASLRVRTGDAERRLKEVEQAFENVRSELVGFGRTMTALQDGVMSLRLVPIDTVFRRFPRIVKETARQLKKEIQFDMVGSDVELDKSICEQMLDPLIHLVRNAIDHGIETPEVRRSRGKNPCGTLRLSATTRGEKVVVEIHDDGNGIDPVRVADKAVQLGIVTATEVERMDPEQRMFLIFRPGFTTADKVTDLSGRGVGMDVVREMIERARGAISIQSTPGEGTTLSLHLPLTLAVVGLLLLKVGESRVALPIHSVKETLRVRRSDVVVTGGKSIICLRGSYIPVVALADLFGLRIGIDERPSLPMVVVEGIGQTMALVVSDFMDKIDTVVKPLGRLVSGAPFMGGATILGDGHVVPVIDPATILREAARVGFSMGGPDLVGASSTGRFRAEASQHKILVVEDSLVMVKHLAGILTDAGYHVETARDGSEGLKKARAGDFDLISTDIEMPGLDGYQMAAELRQEPRFADLPIVAVTSRDDRVDRLQGFRAGFDEYLTKPVVPAAYLVTVGRLLQRARKS